MSAVTRRRVVIALGTLTVLLGLGVAVGLYQRYEEVAVAGEMVAYDVLDEQTASVTISVTRKDPAVPVVCVVRARARDGAAPGAGERAAAAAQRLGLEARQDDALQALHARRVRRQRWRGGSGLR
jgi:hypothetical protein